MGTFAELRARGTDFAALCDAHGVGDAEVAEAAPAVAKAGPPSAKLLRGGSGAGGGGKPPASKDAEEGGGGGRGARNLTGVEARASGRVKRSVYLRFLSAAGGGAAAPIGVVCAFAVEYGSKAFCDAWLSFWAGTMRSAA